MKCVFYYDANDSQLRNKYYQEKAEEFFGKENVLTLPGKYYKIDLLAVEIEIIEEEENNAN